MGFTGEGDWPNSWGSRDQPPRMAADFKGRIAVIDLAPVAQKVDNATRVVGKF